MCRPGHTYKTHKIMKKLIIMSALLISSLSYQAANAQVKVNLNVNLGGQPSWVSNGYQSVNYYYLPDINVYYHVPSKQYTYLQGNRWVNSRALPRQYRNYDLRRGQKVVINQSSPWLRHQSNVNRYASNNNRNDQYNNKKDYKKNDNKKFDNRDSRGYDPRDHNNGRGRG